LYYAKEALPADDFIKRNISFIPKHTRTALLHTRYATKGSPENPDNNHPIIVPSIIGVHNGHISNDDEVFAELGVERIAEVDSEAIFQLLANSMDPVEVLPTLEGRAAIAWYELNDPSTMHLARLSGSPLWVGHTPNGSLVFASTRGLLTTAAANAKVHLQTIWEVPEFMYLKVVKGQIVERRPIQDPNEIFEDEEESEIWEYAQPAYKDPRNFGKKAGLLQMMDKAYFG
jgi:glucosamine 6-phosphate synthetase-like amidotransferase/phosphosugar isomerase protein